MCLVFRKTWCELKILVKCKKEKILLREIREISTLLCSWKISIAKCENAINLTLLKKHE